MALIGQIAIEMSANITKLAKGLGNAQSLLARFGTTGGVAVASGIGAASKGLASLGIGVGKVGVGVVKQLGSVGKSVAGFKASIGGVKTLIAAGLAGTGIALATRSLVGLVRESLNTADAANDAAQAIGTTAGELSGLRYVAKLTGTETESLDAGLKKMAVNLGDAARQGGPTAKSLAELGLNARELAAMDPSQAFLKIAGAISQVKNPALQASYAVDIFGKAGVNLMNTLRAGPEQLGRLAAEAKSLGLAISEDDVAKIGAANDALDRLGYAFQGLGNLIAANVAPALTSGIEAFIKWATEGDRLANALKVGFEKVAEAIRFTRAVIENMGALWTITQLRAEQFFTNVIIAAQTLPGNFKIVTDYIMRNWRELLVDMASGFVSLATNLGKNALSLGAGIWDAIQGRGFTFTATPLLEGFKATAEKLPELITPAFVDLSDEINKLSMGATDGMIESLQRLEKESSKVGETARKATSPGQLPGGVDTPKLASLAEAGSKEAYAVLARNSRGGSGPIDKVAANTAKQVDLQKQTLDALKSGGKAGALPVFAMS